MSQNDPCGGDMRTVNSCSHFCTFSLACRELFVFVFVYFASSDIEMDFSRFTLLLLSDHRWIFLFVLFETRFGTEFNFCWQFGGSGTGPVKVGELGPIVSNNCEKVEI